MKKILIDTSVLIEYLRLKNKTTSYEKIIAANWKPVFNFITVAELWAGKSAWESRNKTQLLENLLSGAIIILPLKSSLKKAGKIKAQYNISLPDAFIASCAIEKKLILATLNTKDFAKIKGLKLLKI